MSLLRVEDLNVHFHTPTGMAYAVDGISFQINKGKTHALVGESGCGKSVTSLAIMGLLSPAHTKISGKIFLNDKNLLSLQKYEVRSLRGSEVSMIFQEPMTALNPVMKVGDQILEAIAVHPQRSLNMDSGITTEHKKNRVLELLRLTGLNESVFHKYPHELSGGMRQRIMIASALSCKPSLLIADEPTTALDVTTQKQILGLMRDLQLKTQTSILMITHNLGVVAETCHTMSIMYAGKIVESGSVKDVFEVPCHPYTKGLFDALPGIGNHRGKLKAIQGTVPPATEYRKLNDCRFYDRCEFKDERCDTQSNRPGHYSFCGRSSNNRNS